MVCRRKVGRVRGSWFLKVWVLVGGGGLFIRIVSVDEKVWGSLFWEFFRSGGVKGRGGRIYVGLVYVNLS